MASQQPRPPWFRFSSMASASGAPPTAPPASIPIRPTQTRPPPPPAAAPPPQSPTPATKSPPTSPVPKPVAIAAATTEPVNGKATTPTIIRPFPPESPKIKTLSHPPSPLTLPPAQLNSDGEREPTIEPKTVLEQQTIDKPAKMPTAHNNGIASNGKKKLTSKDKGTSKKLTDSEESGMRVITLAGENKGAVMELSPSRNKNYHQSLHKNKGTKSGSSSTTESGEEGKSRNKDKADGAMTTQSPMTAYFNSNVQGLNNSVLYDCTFQHHDPGVHLSLIRKANGGPSKD